MRRLCAHQTDYGQPFRLHHDTSGTPPRLLPTKFIMPWSIVTALTVIGRWGKTALSHLDCRYDSIA